MDQKKVNHEYLYRIRIEGALNCPIADWFGDITILPQENGETLLEGRFVDQPARRILFVCLTGQVNEIWYHGMAETEANILRDDMEFGFIYSLTGFYCEKGHSLHYKLQRVGEMIIASLKVP